MVKIIKLASDITERVENPSPPGKRPRRRRHRERNCRQCRQGAGGDRSGAGTSHINHSVNAVSRQIEQLNQQSRSIESIISTISGYRGSDQPVGPQRRHRGGQGRRAGRGFAVVADEVRQLCRQDVDLHQRSSPSSSTTRRSPSQITQDRLRRPTRRWPGRIRPNIIADVNKEIIETPTCSRTHCQEPSI